MERATELRGLSRTSLLPFHAESSNRNVNSPEARGRIPRYVFRRVVNIFRLIPCLGSERTGTEDYHGSRRDLGILFSYRVLGISIVISSMNCFFFYSGWKSGSFYRKYLVN